MKILPLILLLLFVAACTEDDFEDEATNNINIHELVSNLPLVVIDVDWQDLSRNYVQASMKLIDQENKENQISSPEKWSGPINIKYRGSSSYRNPKKQFRIETIDSKGKDKDIQFFDFPPGSDFVLNGPYVDRSLVRNKLAYKLWGEMGHYSVRSRYVEVIVLGHKSSEYRGVYLFTEKIKKDKNRIDVEKLKPSIVDSEEITGGYIFALDHIDEGDQIIETETTYIVKYPKKMNDQQNAYLQDYLKQLERAAAQGDGAKVDELLDIESIVDQMILREFAQDYDAYHSSFFFSKNRGEKIKAGPAWDFNLAFGNHASIIDASGWRWNARASKLFQDLAQLDIIKAQFSKRWNELKDTTFSQSYVDSSIDALVDELGDGQKRNFQTWSAFHVKLIKEDYGVREALSNGAFDVQIFFLKEWLKKRHQWISDNL